MQHKQYPENVSKIVESPSTGKFFGILALIPRLSIVIFWYTMATFVGILLIFSFSHFGLIEQDTQEQDVDLLAIASSLATTAAEVANENDKKPLGSAGAAMRKIFSRTAEKYPEASRQTLYEFSQVDGHESHSILMEWENDLANARRVSSVDRKLELNLARSFVESGPKQIVNVTSTDRTHSWRFVVVDGENDGTRYVYLIVMADEKPVLGVWSILTIFLLVFLSSILVSLLAAYALKRKFSTPPENLKTGLADLKSRASNCDDPLIINSPKGEVFEPIVTELKDLSSSLCLQRNKLVESRFSMDQTLRESAEAGFSLEAVFEMTPSAIVVSDLSGKILIFNHTCRLMFGYGEDDPLPDQVMNLFEPKADMIAILSQQIADFANSERMCVRKSGEVFPALVHASTIKGPDGDAKGLVYVVNDINGSENFREMTRHLDRISIRGAMARDIIHDINNYITVIQGNAELLALLIHKSHKEKIDTKKTEKRLNAIVENVKQISKFMSSMMSIEPIDIKYEREDINQLIHNLIAFLRTQELLHHVEIDLDLSPEIGIQELNAAMIQQLLVNLIYNSANVLAGAELERHGMIKIETMVKNSSSILLTVSDNGPGVAEEHLEALFEESFSTKRKGHGIGLVTCSQIVKFHKGKIRYTGSNTTGARFEIELPRTRSEFIPSASIQTPNDRQQVNSLPNATLDG